MDILIKGMEMPKNCHDCKNGWCNLWEQNKNMTTGRHPHCPLIPVTHCKDCDNFNKETDICTLWGSWTNEDGFCHKTVVLERTT